MNTDEPLLQLDFDETNLNQAQTITNSSQLANSSNKINQSCTQRHLAPSTNSAGDTTTLNTSEPILSAYTGVNIAAISDKTADVHSQHYHQHHRRAFSDDNTLAAVTSSFANVNNQSHSNQCINQTNDPIGAFSIDNKQTQLPLPSDYQRQSLISLSPPSSRVNSSTEEDEFLGRPSAHSERYINSTSLRENDPGTSDNRRHSIDIHPEDTVEVSLLADLSMDSRESQPLLGRDTQDFVYNNFPGEFLNERF